MQPILRLVRFGAVLAALPIVVGCGPVTVNSYAERGVDFARYRTFASGPTDARPTGDPRLDNNPFFQDRLQGQVERQLASRGYRKDGSGNGDLTLHYHISVSQDIDAEEIVNLDKMLGYCTTDDDSCRPSVFDRGVLVVDAVDTATGLVIWRGWAEGRVDGVVNNQKWMEQNIDKVVGRIMEKFPERS